MHLLYTFIVISYTNLHFLYAKLFLSDSNERCLLSPQQSSESCLECKSSYYKKSLLYGDRFSVFNNLDCTLKNSERIEAKDYYVGPGICLQQSSYCDGTLGSPFPDLISAFKQISDLVQAAFYSEVNIRLLKPTTSAGFLITSEDFNPYGIDFFRNINISILIVTERCSDKNLINCYGKDENAIIYIKSEKFSIFVSYHFILANITFKADDLHVSSFPNSCLTNPKVSCCTREQILNNQSSDICGLNHSIIDIPDFALAKERRSFITVSPFLENNQNVIIWIENCIFENWYSIGNQTGDQGWVSFIQSLDCFNYQLNIKNSSFKNAFFPAGLLMIVQMENHFAYHSLEAIERDSLVLYLVSFKKESIICINSLFVSEYNLAKLQNRIQTLSTPFSSIVSVPANISIVINFTVIKDSSCAFESCMFLQSTKIQETPSPSHIIINGLSFTNNFRFGCISSLDVFTKMNTSSLTDLKLEVAPLFNLDSKSKLNLYSVIIANVFSSLGAKLVNIDGLSQLFFNKSTLNSSIQTFFTCSNLSAIHFTDSFLLNLMNSVSVFDSFTCEIIEFRNTVTDSVWAGKYFHDSEDDLIINYVQSEFSRIRSLTFLNSFANKVLLSILINSTKFHHYDTSFVGTTEDDRSNYIIYPYRLKDLLVLNSSFRDSRGLIILRAYYWFNTIVFDGCLFDNLIDVKYYLLLVYQGRDPFKGYEKHTLKNCIFTNSTISISKYWFYPSFFPIFEMSNVYIYNLTHNLTGAPGISRKILLAQRTLNEEHIENLTVIYTSSVNMISIMKSHEVANSFYKNIKVFNLHSTNPRVPGLHIENFPVSTQKKQLVVDSCVFYNLKFLSGTPADTLESRGGSLSINCLESYESNITIINNKFYEIRGQLLKGGALSSTNCRQLNFSGNEIVGAAGDTGGVVYIENARVSEFGANTFKDVKSFSDGGVLYAVFVGNLKMQNLTIENSSALQEGGAIKLRNVDQVLVDQLSISKAQGNYAGVFRLDSCSNSSFKNLIISKFISAKQGGAFSFNNGKISLENVTASEGQAFSGTFIEITHQDSEVSLRNISVKNLTADNEGAFLLSSTIKSLIVKNIIIETSGVKPSGSGVFSVSGFVYTEELKGVFAFDNITCRGTFGRIGSCFFISSNNKITITDLFIENNIGSPVSITSDGETKISILNVNISGTNSKSDPSYQSDLTAVIDILKSNITITNIKIVNNFFDKTLFHINNGEINIKGMRVLKTFIIPPGNLKRQYQIFDITVASVKFFDFEIEGGSLARNITCKALSINDVYLTLDKTNIHGFQTFCIYPIHVLFSEIRIIGSSISDNRGLITGALYSISSDLFMNNTIFSNNSVFINGFNISEKSTLKQKGSHLLIEGDISSEIDYEIQLENCLFIDNNAFSINIQFMDYMVVSNTTFKKTTKNSKNIDSLSAIYLFDVKLTEIYDSSFISLSSLKGAAVWIEAKSLETNISFASQLSMESNIFQQGAAYVGGAIFCEGQNKISILSNTFLENKALHNEDWDESGIGAVGAFDCQFFKNCEILVNSNTFQKNTAEVFGATLLVKTEKLSQSDNVFIENNDERNFSNEISSLPFKAFLLNDTYESLANSTNEQIRNTLKTLVLAKNLPDRLRIASGQAFNFTVIVTDGEYNLLIFDNSSKGTLQRRTVENLTGKFSIEKDVALSQGGILRFTNVKIVTAPDQTLPVEVAIKLDSKLIFSSSIQGLSNGETSISLYFDLEVRPCINGEVFLEDLSCSVCEAGSFMLLNPMNKNTPKKCNKCVENAICLGGADIRVDKDFWISSNNSKLILKCPSQGSCKGTLNVTEVKYDKQCVPHHEGPFCGECDSFSARFRDDSICTPCEQATLIYIKLTAFFILLLIYVYVQTNIFSKLETKAPHAPACLRLALNHFQMLGIINIIKFDWPTEFMSMFSLQDKLSFLTDDYLVIDCVIRLGLNPFIMKTLATCLFPFVFTTVMLFWWILINIFNRKINKYGRPIIDWSFVLERMRITFLIVVYIFHPEILRKCFNMLNCIIVDDHTNETVLLKASNIICWNKEHLIWVYCLVLPAIFFWGILIPICIYILLKKLENAMNDLRGLVDGTKNFSNVIVSQFMVSSANVSMAEKLELEPKINSRGSVWHPNSVKSTSQIIQARNKASVFNKKNTYKAKQYDSADFEISLGDLDVEEKVELGFSQLQRTICKRNFGDSNTSELIKQAEKIGFSKETVDWPSMDNIEENAVVGLAQIKRLTGMSKDISSNEMIATEISTIKANKKASSFSSNMDKLENKQMDEVIDDKDFNDTSKNMCNTSKIMINSSASILESPDPKRFKFKKKTAPPEDDLTRANKMRIAMNIGFLYRGYKPEYYFWEMVVFSRKSLLLFSAIITDVFPIEAKATIFQLILIFFLFLQMKYKPGQYKYLNILESGSLIVAFTMGNIGLLLNSADMQDISLVLLAILIFVNIVFLIFWLYCVQRFVLNKEKIKSFFKNFRENGWSVFIK